jgi:hypothetical protein
MTFLITRTRRSEKLYTDTTIDFMEIIHCPVFYSKTTFLRLDSVLISGYQNLHKTGYINET